MQAGGNVCLSEPRRPRLGSGEVSLFKYMERKRAADSFAFLLHSGSRASSSATVAL